MAPPKAATFGSFVLPGAILEEAAFFYADEQKAVNDQEVFPATLQRLAMPDGRRKPGLRCSATVHAGLCEDEVGDAPWWGDHGFEERP